MLRKLKNKQSKMESSNHCALHIYQIVCFIVAVVLIGRGIYLYSLDDDLTVTKYRDYNSGINNIYPSISLCFGNIFNKMELSKYGISSDEYELFLKGVNVSEKLFEIPYQQVTLNPVDYLLGIEMYQQLSNKKVNQDQHYWYDFTMLNKSIHLNNLNLYVDQFNEWLGTLYKCMTLDIPYINNEHLNRIVIVMKKSIFPNSNRPKFFNGRNLFLVSIAYPNQRLRYPNEKIVWSDEVTNASYVMKFYVMTVEVIQFRQKNGKPCNPRWREDDIIIREKVISNAKCVPPYWKNMTNVNTHYPKCSRKEEMRDIYDDISWDKLDTPCRIITKATHFDSEFPTNRYDNKFENKDPGKYFSARFYFPRPFFKEIRVVRSFDVETMIGNGGGYIGLCLGYSFLQLPGILHDLWKKLKLVCDNCVCNFF